MTREGARGTQAGHPASLGDEHPLHPPTYLGRLPAAMLEVSRPGETSWARLPQAGVGIGHVSPAVCPPGPPWCVRQGTNFGRLRLAHPAEAPCLLHSAGTRGPKSSFISPRAPTLEIEAGGVARSIPSVSAPGGLARMSSEGLPCKVRAPLQAHLRGIARRGVWPRPRHGPGASRRRAREATLFACALRNCVPARVL